MYIQPFNQISKDDVGFVGGKGASLGEMTKANLPVPFGFVITTEANGEIKEEEILKAFDLLSSEKVSVRSSGVAEDSTSASWAGQLETYLNVGKVDLIEKIRMCWDSITSDRAKSYIREKNLSNDKLKMAVIVQKMVESKISGVTFTANPVTGNQNEIMIEAVLGLGENVVQGLLTPDNFIIDKQTLNIKSRDLQKEDEPTLTDSFIEQLSNFGKIIEAHYGYPQDIEWAIDSQNKIWILQSRPITTL